MLVDLEATIAPGGFADMALRCYDVTADATKGPADGLSGGGSGPRTRKNVSGCPEAGCRRIWWGSSAGPPKVDLQKRVIQAGATRGVFGNGCRSRAGPAARARNRVKEPSRSSGNTIIKPERLSHCRSYACSLAVGDACCRGGAKCLRVTDAVDGCHPALQSYQRRQRVIHGAVLHRKDLLGNCRLLHSLPARPLPTG